MIYLMLFVEILFRIFIEIRERRKTQLKGGVFSILRIIPLVNDIVPLPEYRGKVNQNYDNSFETFHEQGHKFYHHGILRNIFKIIMLLLAIWFITSMMIRVKLTLFLSVLSLHLIAIPFRVIFHLYCWNQEYEADKYAYKELGKTKTKNAMHLLNLNEIPYTKLFAILYREHPTAFLRSLKLLK